MESRRPPGPSVRTAAPGAPSRPRWSGSTWRRPRCRQVSTKWHHLSLSHEYFPPSSLIKGLSMLKVFWRPIVAWLSRIPESLLLRQKSTSKTDPRHIGVTHNLPGNKILTDTFWYSQIKQTETPVSVGLYLMYLHFLEFLWISVFLFIVVSVEIVLILRWQVGYSAILYKYISDERKFNLLCHLSKHLC